MKTAILTCALALSTALSTQAITIFSESFGTSDSESALESDPGLDNPGPSPRLESIGGADVRDSSSSVGAYPDASGGNNVFLTDNTEGFYVFGIEMAGYTEFSVSFGGNEAIGSYTGFDERVFTIEYSFDSTSSSTGTWSALGYADSTYTGNGWQDQLMTSDSATVTGSTLALRFMSQVGNNGVGSSTSDLRIDDVSVEATPVPEPSALGLLALGALGLLRRRH